MYQYSVPSLRCSEILEWGSLQVHKVKALTATSQIRSRNINSPVSDQGGLQVECRSSGLIMLCLLRPDVQWKWRNTVQAYSESHVAYAHTSRHTNPGLQRPHLAEILDTSRCSRSIHPIDY